MVEPGFEIDDWLIKWFELLKVDRFIETRQHLGSMPRSVPHFRCDTRRGLCLAWRCLNAMLLLRSRR
ncbi:hypothetical protein OK016_09785 [Vibrio chagasii]|nr:hypothetical protein [Vibrio chagasii]